MFEKQTSIQSNKGDFMHREAQSPQTTTLLTTKYKSYKNRETKMDELARV